MYSILRSATVRVCIISVWLLLLCAAYSHAADSATVRVINTSGGGTVAVVIRNRSDGRVSSDNIIRWTGASATVGAWRVADQYLEITHTGLPEFWGIQIYTDNKNSTPAFTGRGNPAGLVRVNNPLVVIPMAWRISDHLLGHSELNPAERPDQKGTADYLWHFVKDRNTPDDPTTPNENEKFVDGEDYVTIWNQSGIAWNENGRSANPQKAYLYLAARLTTAPVQTEFKTTTLSIEAYHGISPFPLYIYKNAPKTVYLTEPDATLENHYIPGYMNYKLTNPNIAIDDKCTNNPHTGRHCYKITLLDRPGWDGGYWTGVMWLEPKQEWIGGVGKGYDLRGVTHLSFWARTNPEYVDPNPAKTSKMSIFFGLDPDSEIPGSGDSCQRTPPYDLWIPLTDKWQYWMLSVHPFSLTEDMSHVSGGFGVVLAKERGLNRRVYNVYLDDVRFLAPEPLLREYAFASGSENWVFSSADAAALGMNPANGYYNSARGLVIDGATGKPQPKYAKWYYNTAGSNVGIEANRIYKASFKVGTDNPDKATMPMFRVTAHSMKPTGSLLNTSQVANQISIFSNGDGSSSPSAGNNKTYDIYFSVPPGSTENEMAFMFDYINANPGDSSNANAFLKNLTIKQATNIIEEKKIARYDFTNQAVAQRWTFSNADAAGLGMNPANGYYNSARGLVIDGATGKPQPKYAKWFYNIAGSNVGIEANKIYKASFKVGTDNPDKATMPMFRVTAHSMKSTGSLADTLQVANQITISSNGDGSSSPFAGNDRVYDIYFSVPAGSTENEMAFMFDYINIDTNDSSNANVYLKELIVYKMFRDELP